MLRAADVAEILQIGESKSYQIIKELNKELETAGYYTCRGRVSRAYFEKRFFGMEGSSDDQGKTVSDPVGA